MIITPEVKHHEPLEMIRFYKNHFNTVHVIHCTKCKNSIAVELSEPINGDTLGLKANTMGKIVLPTDEKLLGSRPRLDSMMGYLCACGNDTRASEIEEKHSPTGEFLPHEVFAIQNEMAVTGYQAPIKQKNGKEYRDSFAAERF